MLVCIKREVVVWKTEVLSWTLDMKPLLLFCVPEEELSLGSSTLE